MQILYNSVSAVTKATMFPLDVSEWNSAPFSIASAAQHHTVMLSNRYFDMGPLQALNFRYSAPVITLASTSA
jgi:hypothetical protein